MFSAILLLSLIVFVAHPPKAFATEAGLDAWSNASPADKGRYTGLLLFEVATSFVAVTKAGKLSKAEILADIAKRDVDMPGWNAIKTRAAIHGEELATTRMCFVAGTLVLVKLNGTETLLPIEQLEPHVRTGSEVLVWAKCEHTGIEDWRPILAFFKTHPSELHHLALDTSGDGQADETLTGTGEHPFRVEDSGEFTPMRDLVPGMRLTTARSAPAAIILANTRERAPPGGSFTTYNFEVAGFHTYFVGNAGVWVHNAGRYICEKWFAEYMAYKKAANGDHWKGFDDTIAAKAAALETHGRNLPKHQTNSVYNEVLADYLDEGGILIDVPELPNAKPHEIPIDKAFREQHGRKVGAHWNEADPDLPAGRKKTTDRIMLDSEAQVEYKGFQSKLGETTDQLETRIKNEIENAFEKRTKGQGLDEVVVDITNIPDASDEIITNAIERAVGNKGVIGVKYWIFDGTNLREHVVR